MGSSTLETSSESQNFDDTGFFSIQVIQKALESWSLELIPFANERTKSSRQDPTQVIYIASAEPEADEKYLGLKWHIFSICKSIGSHSDDSLNGGTI